MTIYLPVKYHNMLCAAGLQIIIYSHIGTLITAVVVAAHPFTIQQFARPN